MKICSGAASDNSSERRAGKGKLNSDRIDTTALHVPSARDRRPPKVVKPSRTIQQIIQSQAAAKAKP